MANLYCLSTFHNLRYEVHHRWCYPHLDKCLVTAVHVIFSVKASNGPHLHATHEVSDGTFVDLFVDMVPIAVAIHISAYVNFPNRRNYEDKLPPRANGN
jgi:hypothetical protein